MRYDATTQAIIDAQNAQGPTIEDQRQEARQWAQWFREAGYEICFMYTGQPEPFDREWQVWTANGGPRVGTIDIDGTGASWHGSDDLWLQVVGRHVGVTDRAERNAAAPGMCEYPARQVAEARRAEFLRYYIV